MRMLMVVRMTGFTAIVGLPVVRALPAGPRGRMVGVVVPSPMRGFGRIASLTVPALAALLLMMGGAVGTALPAAMGMLMVGVMVPLTHLKMPPLRVRRPCSESVPRGRRRANNGWLIPTAAQISLTVSSPSPRAQMIRIRVESAKMEKMPVRASSSRSLGKAGGKSGDAGRLGWSFGLTCMESPPCFIYILSYKHIISQAYIEIYL